MFSSCCDKNASHILALGRLEKRNVQEIKRYGGRFLKKSRCVFLQLQIPNTGNP